MTPIINDPSISPPGDFPLFLPVLTNAKFGEKYTLLESTKNVAGPHAIRRFDFRWSEVSFEQISGERLAVFGIGGHLECTRRFAANAGFPHQLGDVTAGNAFAAIAEIAYDRSTAISRAALAVESDDLKAKRAVSRRSRARQPMLPCIKSGRRNIQCAAHQAHSPHADMFLNTGISHRDCFANQIAVFFKISRSSVTSASCRRRRRISSS